MHWWPLSGYLLHQLRAGPKKVIDRPDSERFNFFRSIPEEFLANEPFHISHGFLVDQRAIAGVSHKDYSFHLFVNGFQEAPDFIGCLDEPAPEPSQKCRGFLYDFADGLPVGTYEFVGVWIAPCGEFLTSRFSRWESCVDPTEPMTHPNNWRSFEVTFTP